MWLKLLSVLSLSCLIFTLGLSIILIIYMIKTMRKLKRSNRILDRKMRKKLVPIFARLYTIMILCDISAIMLALF